jgi:hypothetical protein
MVSRRVDCNAMSRSRIQRKFIVPGSHSAIDGNSMTSTRPPINSST